MGAYGPRPGRTRSIRIPRSARPSAAPPRSSSARPPTSIARSAESGMPSRHLWLPDFVPVFSHLSALYLPVLSPSSPSSQDSAPSSQNRRQRTWATLPIISTASIGETLTAMVLPRPYPLLAVARLGWPPPCCLWPVAGPLAGLPDGQPLRPRHRNARCRPNCSPPGNSTRSRCPPTASSRPTSCKSKCSNSSPCPPTGRRSSTCLQIRVSPVTSGATSPSTATT